MNEKVSRKNLKVPQALAIVGLHVLAVFALFPKYFSWEGVVICLFLHWIIIGMGIGAGYHRSLVHKSFETYQWLFNLLMFLGASSWQGGPITWALKHFGHHEFADKDGDPHSPVVDGFLWAHILWTMFKAPEKENNRIASKVAKLKENKTLVWIEKYFWLPQVLWTVLLFVAGFYYGGIDIAFGWVVWGIGVRTVFGWHATWSVNSIAHMWGERVGDNDNSRNLLPIALITFGEGWHSWHHVDQRSALHGWRKWFEIDITGMVIFYLYIVGLVNNVVWPSILKSTRMK